MMARPTPIERAHYEKLVGRRITGIRWEELELRPLPVLILSGKDHDGYPAKAAVLCDPEGNAPGHLEHSL